MLTAAAAPAGWKHCTSPRRRNLCCAVIQTESRGKEMGQKKGQRKRKEEVEDQEDERKGKDQQGSDRKKHNQNTTQNPTLRACTRPMLPSNLMIWVCSHFHSDRKGTMRKIEEAVRRKNKSDEDCYRPQRPPQSLSLWLSLSYFHWDNVDKNLWMQSSHILQIQWMLQGASLTVQGAQADLLCWSSWPLSHILCTASSPNFCCQVDNSS